MVHGYAFGGAFTQLCACDFAIIAEDATLGLSEVNWGIIPAGNVVTFQASLVDDARPGWELPWCSVYTFKDGLIIADSAYLNHRDWPGVPEAMQEARPEHWVACHLFDSDSGQEVPE